MATLKLVFILSAVSLVLGQDIHYNVSYGVHEHQVMDIYNLGATTEKVILLIHGGGWNAGQKEEMDHLIPDYSFAWPNYGIVNMNYRLGTIENPGYPMQLVDIESVITHVQSRVPGQNLSFALVGGSAGAHLSMLYGYSLNNEQKVKAIVNIVGPANMTDPQIAYHPLTSFIYLSFVGPYFYGQNPQLWNTTSPTTWVTSSSPPTISFWGETDILVPVSQPLLLKSALDRHNVPNENVIFPGGHYGWPEPDYLHMINRTTVFLNEHF